MNQPKHMKRTLLILSIFTALFLSCPKVRAQNQTVTNGGPTTAITMPGTGCTYNWVNDTPGIGLAASGTGDIPSFTAVNNGTIAVKATITATPTERGFAYVPNSGDGTVSVVNTATNTVVSTIPVGAFPFAVAVSADGKRVYITNEYSKSVSVINTANNTVMATVTVGTYPDGAAVSPDGTRAYITNNSDGIIIGGNTVSVINTLTNSVISTVTVGPNPLGVSVSPNGAFVYVANSNSNTVSVIQAATNTVSATITVGLHPFGVCFSPDGNTAYVTNHDTQNVAVINTATNAVITTVNVGAAPYGICSSPDGKNVYVANLADNTISVINTALNSVTSTIPVGALPYGVSVSSDGNSVYVVTRGTNSISTINTTTNMVSTSTTVGSTPYSFGNFFIGAGCSTITSTITVNPSPASPPTITTSIASGTISACVGTASLSPQIQQFTVSGSNLAGNIIASSPTGFEVSLSAGSGYSSSVTLTQSNGIVNSTTVYVRSAASASAGSISGNVTLASAGYTSQTVAVTGTVKALPTVNTIASQNVNNGAPTTAVNFTGTGNTFNWVNDTPGIGLAASGTGDIASFPAVNTGSSPVIATITATSVFSGFAYIPNAVDNNVSVVNTATNKVVTTIQVGKFPESVTVSQDGSLVYVVNNGDNTVSAINTATNAVIAVIPVGNTPVGIAISPDGSKVYVGNELSNSVSVISTATNTVTSIITAGSNPFGLTLSPDGSRLYVVNGGGGNISVINTATGALVSTMTFPSGSQPGFVAISPDGNTAYVTLAATNQVAVVNTADNVIIATVAVGNDPFEIAVSPDGSRVYVANQAGSTNLSVINTATNTVDWNIPVGLTQEGVSVSPDGTLAYATNLNAGTLTVINTATEAIVTTVNVGVGCYALGNFVSGAGCSSAPVKFTITVEPNQALPPAISVNPTTGSISACAGTASASPQLQQFTVSGSNLTADITITAPANFEISLSATGGYVNALTLIQSGGTVNNTVVYVRSAANAPAGSLSDNVTIASSGASTLYPTVSATINALPILNAVPPQTFTNGTLAGGVTFTGTVTNINWVNDTPGIGLAASGNGNIMPFTAINTGSSPVVATIIATPAPNSAGCAGAPVTFTITVTPSAASQATITATGSPSPLNTIYGTPSTSTIFTVSGANMTAGILVSPPPGFEVSTNDITFSSTVTIGAAGTIATSTVYIRLAASTHVGNYSGNIGLTSTGAATVNVAMPASTVTKADLTITANNKSKTVGEANPVLTASYNGFVNNDGPAQLASQPILTTTATVISPVGQYPITVSGASSPDYNITPVPGILTVTAVPLTVVIPNTFTPNGDGVNDTWDIKYIDSYPNCTVEIFNRYGESIYSSIGYGTPWNGTYKGAALPTSTYYYIINLKNGGEPLSGFIAIIR